MRTYWTLVKRELGGFFYSWTGYVVMAAVLLLLGLSFVNLITVLNNTIVGLELQPVVVADQPLRERGRSQERLAAAKPFPLLQIAAHRKLDQIEAVGVATVRKPLSGRIVDRNEPEIDVLVGNNAEVVTLCLPGRDMTFAFGGSPADGWIGVDEKRLG